MSMMRWSTSVAAAVMVCAVTAVAQTPSSPATDQKGVSPAITVTGCVQKESAVLKRNPAAGSIGMGDEFVLTNSAITPAPGSNEAPKPDVQAPPPEPTGTSGSANNFGIVYRLTGDKESELKSYVGQRVLIAGTLKAKEKATDELSSIGTSGKAAEGASTPDNTRELIIDSITPAAGTCAPVK
jgi:hypothetical protein